MMNQEMMNQEMMDKNPKDEYIRKKRPLKCPCIAPNCCTPGDPVLKD